MDLNLLILFTMKTSLTLVEKIISALLLIIGIVFSYQAISGYILTYIIYFDAPTSYRISIATYVSNLLIGNLLIISSLLFFKRKALGVLLYKYTGIMVILYAINLNLFDIIAYPDIRWFDVLLGAFLLLALGSFLCIYFCRKNDLYKSKLILPSFIILGIITYIYIDLFFCDWYYYFHIQK